MKSIAVLLLFAFALIMPSYAQSGVRPYVVTSGDIIQEIELLKSRGKDVCNYLAGSTVRFPKKYFKDGMSNFYNLIPDTLWVKQKRQPRENIDYFVFSHYKSIDKAKTIKTRLLSSPSVLSGLQETPQSAILDKEFTIIRCYDGAAPHAPVDTTKKFISLEMQSQESKDIVVWSIQTSYPLMGLKTSEPEYQFLFRELEFLTASEAMLELYRKIATEKNAEIMAKKTAELNKQKLAEYNKRKAEFKRDQEEGSFDLSLIKVEKPTNSMIKYGKTSTITDKDKLQYVYADNYINIAWFVGANDFAFTLSNKSPYSIKIIWDDAVYINEDGVSDKVFHSGIKYTDRNAPQPPTVVLKDAMITDLLSPVGKVSYYNGYGRERLFNFAQRKSLTGKTVRVSLPIQIQGITNEYVFTFKIDWKCKYPALQGKVFGEFNPDGIY